MAQNTNKEPNSSSKGEAPSADGRLHLLALQDDPVTVQFTITTPPGATDLGRKRWTPAERRAALDRLMEMALPETDKKA